MDAILAATGMTTTTTTATATADSGASDSVVRLPKKRFFRQHAHANPFSDHELPYPLTPQEFDYAAHFGPPFNQRGEHGFVRKVEFADVGCGYGGLLMDLATSYPEKLSLGFEIREKVSEYVRRKILGLRAQSQNGMYKNISVVRVNAMKYLMNFFERGQLSKMFFLFPDPHFKRKKHKARIISSSLLSEYAYLLRPGGVLYTNTDVHDLHLWMVEHLDAHPLFMRIPDEELKNDPVVKCIMESTEEGAKVRRNGGSMYPAVYTRISDPNTSTNSSS